MRAYTRRVWSQTGLTKHAPKSGLCCLSEFYDASERRTRAMAGESTGTSNVTLEGQGNKDGMQHTLTS